MGNNNEVFSNLQSAIRDVLNTPGLDVKPESTLFDDLGLESIDLLDLSCDLEKSLGRELDFKKIIQHVTKTRGVTPKQVQVQDVVAFINSEV